MRSGSRRECGRGTAASALAALKRIGRQLRPRDFASADKMGRSSVHGTAAKPPGLRNRDSAERRWAARGGLRYRRCSVDRGQVYGGGGRRRRQSERRVMNSVLFSSVTDEWSAPERFFNKLNRRYRFTLDPCATAENAKCAFYFTKEQDGLQQNWGTHRVFCNPP
jgi:hypothetical protein